MVHHIRVTQVIGNQTPPEAFLERPHYRAANVRDDKTRRQEIQDKKMKSAHSRDASSTAALGAPLIAVPPVKTSLAVVQQTESRASDRDEYLSNLD
ncbi:hypothetical protein PsorP6_000536 [Peronosclerospora sorghi]|uniref:Uncharacterized protein n=1 Tax=Peronosclerospora sorghi TaxID=230839 RepID=A0ACC0WSV0_9STRA|nr:hypothetical protein PsorP6_000536 [Peronosclerospora sorghi]